MEKLEKNKVLFFVVKILAITIAAAVTAFNINSFVNAGDLIPGGVTGISILVQRIFKEFFSMDIPYSAVFLPLNVIPIVIGFVFVGKKFTLYSLYFVVTNSILVDLLPKVDITQDILLICIFGGIISGFSVALTLIFSASTGGFDFISIFLSEKKNINAWNIIFAINVVILGVTGILFGWDKALYSIIYQFVVTQSLNMLDKRYQKDTLLIVTDQPSAVSGKIRTITSHGATVWEGTGEYLGKKRTIVYSVIGRNQVRHVMAEIKKVDNDAFINVLQTAQLQGNFNKEKRD